MLQNTPYGLELPTYKVLYTAHNEELEEYTNDKNWWLEFARIWSHITIKEFKEAVFTSEEKLRAKEIVNISENFASYASTYVLTGKFPDELQGEERLENHPLKELQMMKRSQQLGQQATGIELENMMLRGQVNHLGQQNTGLELENMAMKSQMQNLGQQVTTLELMLMENNNKQESE